MKTILGQVQFFHSLDFQIYNSVHFFIIGIFSFLYPFKYLEAPFIRLTESVVNLGV